jgi:hypothetical protein
MEQFSRRSCARRPGAPIRTDHRIPTTVSPDNVPQQIGKERKKARNFKKKIVVRFTLKLK